MTYLQRTIEPFIGRAAAEFPVVMLTGPRQSGKTTLLQHLFSKTQRYLSMELPDVQAAAIDDPRGFLELYPPPAIFDEIQYAPGLLPYIKERVDAARQRMGQFILTGSQNILLAQGVSESLAGRVAMLRLLPLSFREILKRAQTPLPWEEETRIPRSGLAYKELWESFLRGGYPELVVNPERDLGLWHASYVQTYLERDVRALRQVGELGQFQSFLRALAARSAQLFNIADLARDLGVAVNTVRAWLSVLEATYQIVVLRPYYANVGKRLVKTSKVYFADVGTLCYLVGLRDAAHAAAGPMGGAIMETAVVNEVVRTMTHRGQEPRLYFWRTAKGSEVDLLVDTGVELIPLEIKLSTTPAARMAAGIDALRRDLGERVQKGYVVHPGEARLPITPNAVAWPFGDL